ncbi:GDSL-type esterase/lipase family protein [Trueperella pyogenes]|uniref:GDSL-type esterase/lipase family protein n=1 Tax=Trueperella pyogenes TaxID=1661 RepID=X4RBV3_9ACTO|nr:GDSL-type esterase/lipase family protein [Trueperella pyogenes]AHU90259.1 lysophospholipase [Trueperella pyogenes]ALD74617.1 lysophospholipase [Trueperella pyogenes]AWA44587.1 lysophospholipase [Trueperella pyogenes]AWG04872.1 lysophospholipase [Trueperella pyogenes]AWG17291.1 lysophospholipase [Trueperella pyogenes]
MRVFFVGDELVAGYGDARGLGWVGRTVARSPIDPPIMAISLAHPGETTDKLVARWEAEVLPRVDHDSDNRLVIGLGSRDVGVTSTARSRLHLANMLDNAMRSGLSPFVVGPPPRLDISAREQAELTRAFSEVCERRKIPFVDTYTPLRNHEQWLTDMATSVDSYCPRQAGYGLMTWLVFHKGWHRWLGIEPPAAQ